MPQDAFTLKYLCDQLNSIFAGGKVNKIIQPNGDKVALTVYTGKCTTRLLIDVNPSSPRIGVISSEIPSPLTAPNFCMLLRKHLLSATLDGIKLVGFDRIVKIDFTSSSEFFDSVQKTLYVELMGRYSNIILTENGKILGGNRGINMFDDGVRPLIVGQKYVFPPVGNKKEPCDQSLVDYFTNCSGDTVEYICQGVQGLAKSTAGQMVKEYFDVVGEENSSENIAKNPSEFCAFMREFLYNSTVKPCVLMEDGEVKDFLVKPYDVIKGELRYFDDLISAEDFYYENKVALKRFKDAKERVTNLTNTAVKKAKKRLTAILAKEKDALSADQNKLMGELILANAYKIKSGAESVVLENYYDDYKPVTVLLDKNLSPTQNAERYYKKYNKQKRTLNALAPQKEQAQAELNYFLSVLEESTLCESYEDALAVLSELESAGVVKSQNQPKKKKREDADFREYSVLGFTVKVGRNNVENDRLTFGAKGEDLWLHSKDYHSSHVIIESQGKEIPEEVVTISAEICAYFSKAREGGKSEVVYTKRKFIKKPPRSKPGFCIYENFSSVTVTPNKRLEFAKKG